MEHFFTKMGKIHDLNFGTLYIDGLCPKLYKKPCKAKIGSQIVLYYSSCPFLRSSKSIEICNFWLKSAPKSHFIYVWEYYIIAIYIFTIEIYQIWNMWSRDDQKITCAQIYEHPFIIYILGKIWMKQALVLLRQRHRKFQISIKQTKVPEELSI